MIKSVAVNDDLSPLLELAGRVGRNPLLTQASTGTFPGSSTARCGSKLPASGWLTRPAGRFWSHLIWRESARASGRISIRRNFIRTHPLRPPCT